jgi:probable F420-dependent oxidoreductase
MASVDLGPVGVALNVSADDTYLAEAAELEALGYSAVWLPGGELDSLDRLEGIVGETTAVPVAPAIIPPDLYDAPTVAATYSRLERASPGRFVVGLGVPHRPRPLQSLNDYLDRLDAADPPVPAGRRILGVLGPRMLELARDRCAGAVPLLVTPEFTPRVREILGEEPTLVVYQLAVGDTDPARARQTAREPMLRGLPGDGGYGDKMRWMGFRATDVAELRDNVVDGLVAWGDDAAIVDRVEAQLDAVADHALLGVLKSDDQPGPIEMARRLADRLVA